MEPVTVGVIGCGVISDAYLKGAKASTLLRVKSVADRIPEAAKAKAEAWDVQAASVDALLADPEIEIVVNLTVPLAHHAVGVAILEAGKHLYAEKPLAVDGTEAADLLDRAERAGLRVGCAPDTFLGASHQAARRAIDQGRIGRVVAGSAAVLSHGMEHWHPNPRFFFERGGGPVLDIGPYYVTQLVNLLGPVASVTAVTGRGFPTRTVTSEPRAGEVIEVQVDTTAAAVLAFQAGAIVTLTTSWDVWKHRHVPFELWGTEGSMLVPDPNFFGGDLLATTRDGEWEPLGHAGHPFGEPNRTLRSGAVVADHRAIGLVDMAAGIRLGRPHRASGALAAHVLDVLDAVGRSAALGSHVAISVRDVRPAALPQGVGEAVFLEA